MKVMHLYVNGGFVMNVVGLSVINTCYEKDADKEI